MTRASETSKLSDVGDDLKSLAATISGFAVLAVEFYFSNAIISAFEESVSGGLAKFLFAIIVVGSIIGTIIALADLLGVDLDWPG